LKGTTPAPSLVAINDFFSKLRYGKSPLFVKNSKVKFKKKCGKTVTKLSGDFEGNYTGPFPGGKMHFFFNTLMRYNHIF
jgi:hypothetical protein